MNSSVPFSLYLLLGLVLVVACSTTSRKVYEGRGLAKGQPGMNRYTEDEPGETTPLERPYDIAPPLIPHSVEGLSINRTANDCFDCHSEGEELDEGHIATKIPFSHYVNEYSGKQENDRVTGVHYNCLQCHVPQADVGVPSSTEKAK